MSEAQKYFPCQGQVRFETVTIPVLKGAKAKFNDTSTGTYPLYNIPAGTVLFEYGVRAAEKIVSVAGGAIRMQVPGIFTSSGGLADGNDEYTPAFFNQNLWKLVGADTTFNSLIQLGQVDSGAADYFALMLTYPNQIDSNEFETVTL